MESPVFKRKKCFSKGDILQKLKDNNFKIKQVCDDICEELCPFDISDEDLLLLEDQLERLEKVSRTLTAKVSRVCKAFKEKKFRRHPEQLEEKEISCSQYSLFQSPDSDKIEASQNQEISGSDESGNGKREMETSRPSSYKKRPLNNKMS